MLLRMAEPSEAEALLTAFLESVPSSPYILTTLEMARTKTAESQKEWIEKSNSDPGASLIVGEYQNEIVAIANSLAYKDPKRSHRASLGMSVRKDFRGQGLGEAILLKLIAVAKENQNLQFLELNVMEANTAAHALYQKLGFKEVGRYPQAYRQPNGELLTDIAMALTLN